MNGPARLIAWASPFSVRSLTSQLRCASAKASGAFPVLCAASVKVTHDLHGKPHRRLARVSLAGSVRQLE
jgi:hypothetical protein